MLSRDVDAIIFHKNRQSICTICYGTFTSSTEVTTKWHNVLRSLTPDRPGVDTAVQGSVSTSRIMRNKQPTYFLGPGADLPPPSQLIRRSRWRALSVNCPIPQL
jgi:hypothetical protein